MEDTNILAESVSEHIKYNMLKDVLVKPLAPIMLLREFDVPVVKETVKEDGEEINEFEETTKETREVPSAFSKGIVLKMPKAINGLDWDFVVGDTVIFNGRFAIDFDILKDTKLVKPYDIVAVER